MNDAFDNGLFLDFSIERANEEGNRAYFGRNVLQGLIDGVEDFVHERQPRWERRSHRVGAPVMLGCSPWVGDDKQLEVIEALPGACILISKHPRTDGGRAKGRGCGKSMSARTGSNFARCRGSVRWRRRLPGGPA